ncbi:protein POLYCHOME-like [Prosopis cineraria]|uniref:protein POLYCHOME-like n=1 Tax=Prosopis cineraria TaxID=364024 RepID=UPI00240F6113|nr:protein POLYCHOME-like [Prosopis cineraria]XP_054779199.1 protein POLYCHOME-like [Prosopis cineraria]
MPESRDRRLQPVDIAAVFSRQRSGAIGMVDDELESALFRSTPSRENTIWTASGQAAGLGVMRAGGNVSGGFVNSRTGSPTADRNSPSWTDRRVRIRPSRSVLPSWYPRTPLRDITAVVRAIERRRVRLRESRGQQPTSPSPADQSLANSPNPTNGHKLRTPAGSKFPKLLLDITNQSDERSEFLTPQKKLLNSIDMVEKVVKEELQKLKRTPSAKKADRERRVRTLMSMR